MSTWLLAPLYPKKHYSGVKIFSEFFPGGPHPSCGCILVAWYLNYKIWFSVKYLFLPTIKFLCSIYVKYKTQNWCFPSFLKFIFFTLNSEHNWKGKLLSDWIPYTEFTKWIFSESHYWDQQQGINRVSLGHNGQIRSTDKLHSLRLWCCDQTQLQFRFVVQHCPKSVEPLRIVSLLIWHFTSVFCHVAKWIGDQWVNNRETIEIFRSPFTKIISS